MKRLIFCCSSGRSGTAALAALLSKVHGMVATHEPEPKYQNEMLKLQTENYHQVEFIKNVKAPVVLSNAANIYAESSHLLHKGFAEAWFELGYQPDLIVLRYDPRMVARSLFEIGFDFFEKREEVLRWLLHPEDKRRLFVQLDDWKYLNNYQLCLWYALEIEQRCTHYAQFYKDHGARVIETSIEGLKKTEKVVEFVNWLGYDANQFLVNEILSTLKTVHNPKTDQRIPERVNWIQVNDLDSEALPIFELFSRL